MPCNNTVPTQPPKPPQGHVGNPFPPGPWTSNSHELTRFSSQGYVEIAEEWFYFVKMFLSCYFHKGASSKNMEAKVLFRFDDNAINEDMKMLGAPLGNEFMFVSPISTIPSHIDIRVITRNYNIDRNEWTDEIDTGWINDVFYVTSGPARLVFPISARYDVKPQKTRKSIKMRRWTTKHDRRE